jgi:hypothetical protein
MSTESDASAGELKNHTLYELSESAISQSAEAVEGGHPQAAARYLRMARDDLDELAKRLEARANEEE